MLFFALNTKTAASKTRWSSYGLSPMHGRPAPNCCFRGSDITSREDIFTNKEQGDNSNRNTKHTWVNKIWQIYYSILQGKWKYLKSSERIRCKHETHRKWSGSCSRSDKSFNRKGQKSHTFQARAAARGNNVGYFTFPVNNVT